MTATRHHLHKKQRYGLGNLWISTSILITCLYTTKQSESPQRQGVHFAGSLVRKRTGHAGINPTYCDRDQSSRNRATQLARLCAEDLKRDPVNVETLYIADIHLIIP